jgi:hypothetical protein
MLAEAREAVHLNPKNAQAHVTVTMTPEGKGDVDPGIAEYREAVRLNPDCEMRS